MINALRRTSLSQLAMAMLKGGQQSGIKQASSFQAALQGCSFGT
jgi:hypothetical protein